MAWHPAACRGDPAEGRHREGRHLVPGGVAGLAADRRRRARIPVGNGRAAAVPARPDSGGLPQVPRPRLLPGRGGDGRHPVRPSPCRVVACRRLRAHSDGSAPGAGDVPAGRQAVPRSRAFRFFDAFSRAATSVGRPPAADHRSSARRIVSVSHPRSAAICFMGTDARIARHTRSR